MKEELHNLFQEIEATETKLKQLKEKVQDLNPNKKSSVFFSDTGFSNLEVKALNNILEKNGDLDLGSHDFSEVGQWSYYFQTEELKWSSETYEIFDYPSEYKGKLNDFCRSCLNERGLIQLEKFLETSRTSLNTHKVNDTIFTPKGVKKLICFSSSPILNAKGEIIGVEGLVKDISDNMTGKIGLDIFMDLSYDLHCVVHWDSYFLKISPSWSKVLGYDEEEILSRSFLNFVHPEDMDRTIEIMKQIDIEGSTVAFKNRYISKSGEIVYLSWNTYLDSETQLAYCTARDITKATLAQNALLSDLNEKDLMLKEIHHRVKNNLQIISSLLSLQAGANSDEEKLTKLYQDSQNRIQSMASIHEMFYQSEELDQIEFGKYLNKLVGDLALTFASKNIEIKFALNISPILVSLDTAIPLGLLINEVVTNSIKHGGDKQGNVNVFIDMEAIQDNKFQFTFGDKGVNSQQNILKSSEESLGVLLINSLVEQLDGEIEQLDSFEGTVFKLTFTNNVGNFKK